MGPGPWGRVRLASKDAWGQDVPTDLHLCGDVRSSAGGGGLLVEEVAAADKEVVGRRLKIVDIDFGDGEG
ncbi:hypothetical protein Tco_1318867 [Tanacetum coccineum]